MSGAPRANHSGAVVLLKKEKNQRALSLEHMFEGEGLASSFGYDVAVVDLNNDGYGLGNSCCLYNEGWQSGLFLLSFFTLAIQGMPNPIFCVLLEEMATISENQSGHSLHF